MGGGGGTEVIVERRQGEECKKIEELSGEILLREKKKNRWRGPGKKGEGVRGAPEHPRGRGKAGRE